MSKQYLGTTEYFPILAELIRAARYRGTVTYQELADLIGLPLRGAYMGGELGEYLGAISEEEAKQSRPMLSAITITVAGEPGGGFFAKAKELGKFTGESAAERAAFWEAEKQAVYKTWQKSFPKS